MENEKWHIEEQGRLYAKGQEELGIDPLLLEADDDWRGLFDATDRDDLDWLQRVAVLLGISKPAQDQNSK